HRHIKRSGECKPKWIFFFFSSRRRHTRSLRDWSSDVCSSDLRQLAEESKSRVDVSALAEMRIYKPAVEFRLAGIMHAQERSVLGVEFRPEIKATLLHPALEVVLGNLVRMIEERIIRHQEFDGGILISDARKGTNDRRCSFF